MKFSDKAIYGTIIGLILYQIISFYLFITFPRFQDFFWINQLIFATSTSFGAVFWSLYITRKYEKFANFENLVSKVYDDIEDFREQLLKFKKFLANPLVESILSGDDDNDIDQEQKTQELLKKYTTKRNEGNG